MDEIRIKNLEIFANHGVYPEENRLGQVFVVSAVLYTDVRTAGMTDDLSASIHYGEVAQKIKTFVEVNTFQLLERVVEQLAIELLTTIPRLQKVELEIKKPWAPIGLPLDTVSVKIERGWHRAYIAFGSNMGDKKAYLNQGIEMLRQVDYCRVTKVSDFITTAPYGYLDQEEFVNGCLEIETLLYPHELLEQLHKIEKAANRERKIHWGPRTLDLDIIFYDDLVVDTEDLQIPHVEMQLRDFVLIPLCQIAPYKRHPILNKTVKQVLAELEKTE